MSWPKHGANPHYLYEKLNIAMPEESIDFSVNINPFGPPPNLKRKWHLLFNEVEAYPDPLARHLKAKIAQRKAISPQTILIGNGAAELIQLIAITLQNKQVAIFQPTFSEYERMCRAYGVNINNVSIDTLSKPESFMQLTQRYDAIFLCHPNNPSGEIYPQKTLLALLAECEKNDCFLILDEAFYDFVLNDISFVKFVGKYRKLIVLQSMTKMFAIAGVRLGVCFAAPSVIEKLRSYQAYWSVNGIALKIGELILDEEAYVEKVAGYMADQRRHLFPQLSAFGYQLSASRVNYFLLRDPKMTNQEPLLIFLMKKGIIPRHTMNYPSLDGKYLRFSIRKSEEMTKLLEALKQWQDK